MLRQPALRTGPRRREGFHATTDAHVGVLATLALSALSATSAAAAGTHKPDGWVRIEGYHNDGSNDPAQGPWKGKDIYNTTALNQKATGVVGGAIVRR